MRGFVFSLEKKTCNVIFSFFACVVRDSTEVWYVCVCVCAGVRGTASRGIEKLTIEGNPICEADVPIRKIAAIQN